MGDSKEPAYSAKIAPELSDTQRMMYAFGDSRRPKVEEDDETDDKEKIKMIKMTIIRMKMLKKTQMNKYVLCCQRWRRLKCSRVWSSHRLAGLLHRCAFAFHGTLVSSSKCPNRGILSLKSR